MTTLVATEPNNDKENVVEFDLIKTSFYLMYEIAIYW